MTIDLALLDRVTQKVVQTPTGTVLRAYDGATVLNEIALSSDKLPGEINDIMQMQRTAIAHGVDSFVGSKVDPITGRLGLIQDIYLGETYRGVPSKTVLDFSNGIPTGMTVQAAGGTVNIVYNPTGWHDGSGCLEFTPTGANPTMRAFLDANTQFKFASDDGWGIEVMLPSVDNKAVNYQVTVGFGAGAVSTAVPANRIEQRIFDGLASNSGNYFSGVKHDRYRWDCLNTDLKAGPNFGYLPSVYGSGITKNSVVNWMVLYCSDAYLGKTIKIKRVTAGGKGRPALVVTVDYLSDQHLDLIGSKLSSFGWRFNGQFMSQDMDLVTGYLGTKRDYLTRIWRSGGDMNPNDVIDRNLRTADYSTAKALIKQNIADMKSVGTYSLGRGTNFYVYNFNGYNDDVIRAFVEEGMIAGRAGIQENGRFTFTENGVVNSMRMPAKNWDTASVQSMKDQIDRAIEYGVTIHVYYHKVWSKAQVVLDGFTAPGATETTTAYYNARVAASDTAAVSYLTARGITNDNVSNWSEDLLEAFAYARQKELSGEIDFLLTSEWMNRVGLFKPTP